MTINIARLGQRFGIGELTITPIDPQPYTSEPQLTFKRVRNTVSVFGIPVDEFEEDHFLGPISPMLSGDTSGLYGLPTPLLIGQASGNLIGDVTGVFGPVDNLEGRIASCIEFDHRKCLHGFGKGKLMRDGILQDEGHRVYERMRQAQRFLPEEYAMYAAITFDRIQKVLRTRDEYVEVVIPIIPPA